MTQLDVERALVERLCRARTSRSPRPAWAPNSLTEYLEHELLHCLESIFEGASAEVPHPHDGWAFEAAYQFGAESWYAWLLDNAPYQNYLDRPGPWGTVVRAAEGFAPGR